MVIETIIYVALLIALFCVCDNSLSRRYYVPLKVVCSASFLVILWINQCLSEKLWLMLWALLAFFIGDMLSVDRYRLISLPLRFHFVALDGLFYFRHYGFY